MTDVCWQMLRALRNDEEGWTVSCHGDLRVLYRHDKGMLP
jgi:hypothetical protein